MACVIALGDCEDLGVGKWLRWMQGIPVIIFRLAMSYVKHVALAVWTHLVLSIGNGVVRMWSYKYAKTI